MSNVIWTPQPKQILMMSRAEDEGLYGGAAGGGKSDYMVAEAMRQVEVPNYRGLILRKTFPELTDLIDRSTELYSKAYPKAKFNDSKHVWKFPSGAKIYFGSLQHTKDKYKYQGKRYDFIGFDELTQFTWEEYSYLMSRNRAGGPGTRIYMRATANPGGVGHGWVKQRFVTITQPYHTYVQEVKARDPNGKEFKQYRTRIFIPSSVFDNQELLKNDPGYLGNLAMLPKAERDALLYGDWDSFSGQVFIEFTDNPEGYDSHEWTHVINPFRIPSNWLIYRGFDFGYTKPFSVGWYAVDERGCIYRIREMYGCVHDSPNTGVKLAPQEIAKDIMDVEASDPNLKGRKIIGIADPAIFDESHGESIAAMMERSGTFWSPGDHTRLAGLMQYHYRLAFDTSGHAMFYVFNTCREFIRTFPSLVYDDTHVEDINTDQEDHIYDECRYVLMEHPIAPRLNVAEKPPAEDPLDLWADKKKSEVQYFHM